MAWPSPVSKKERGQTYLNLKHNIVQSERTESYLTSLNLNFLIYKNGEKWKPTLEIVGRTN